MNLRGEVNIRTDKRSHELLITGALLLWLFLLTLLLPWPAEESFSLEVHVGQTVEITSSFRYCWFPTVHQFSTGEILATMDMSPDEVHPEGEFSAYCISRDGGQTWSRRYTMGAGANNDAAYTQATRRDGTVWVLGAGYDSLEPYPPSQTQDFHATLTKYSRGGMELNQARDVVIHLSQPALLQPTDLYDRHVKDASRLTKSPEADPWGAILAGSKGDLLTTFYYITEEDQRQRRLVLIRSTDGGRSWNEDGTIAAVMPNEKAWPWMGKEGPNESGIVRLADGHYYCIFRTGGDEGFMGEAWSTDNDGRTWSPPLSTGFKGVAPHLRMMSNGVLACGFGRPGPVTVMFSVGGTGKKWTNLTPIFSGMSTRYTDLIEVSPGKLFVVYDSVPYSGGSIPASDTVSKNTIYGTFIEVRKR